MLTVVSRGVGFIVVSSFAVIGAGCTLGRVLKWRAAYKASQNGVVRPV